MVYKNKKIKENENLLDFNKVACTSFEIGTNFASYGNCQEPISCNCLISFDISKLPLYVLEVFFLHPEGVNNQLRKRTVALNNLRFV